jgi:hypothetical protein
MAQSKAVRRWQSQWHARSQPDRPFAAKPFDIASLRFRWAVPTLQLAYQCEI